MIFYSHIQDFAAVHEFNIADIVLKLVSDIYLLAKPVNKNSTVILIAYQNIGEEGFTEQDHIRLRDALLKAEGKFLLSYNDCPLVRELYDAPGIQIESVSRLNNIRQRYDPNCQFAEVFIANYDLTERQRCLPAQLNLFEEDLL